MKIRQEELRHEVLLLLTRCIEILHVCKRQHKLALEEVTAAETDFQAAPPHHDVTKQPADILLGPPLPVQTPKLRRRQRTHDISNELTTSGSNLRTSCLKLIATGDAMSEAHMTDIHMILPDTLCFALLLISNNQNI